MKEIHGSTLAVDIEEDEEELECPECGRSFDYDEWGDRDGYYYPRAGGSTYYDCPEKCNGTIVIHV